MKLLVIGASGGIGLATVKLALERGHTVRAFARSATAMSLDHPALETCDGDATDAGDMARAVAGVDAVIVALGIPRSARALLRPVSLFSKATEVLVPAMREAGCRRLLVVTGFGSGGSYNALSAVERIGFKAVMGRAYADKDRQETLVRDSGLDWTIARPTVLTNGSGRGRYQVLTDPQTWRNGLISRASVADFLVRAAESGAYQHQAVVLAR